MYTRVSMSHTNSTKAYMAYQSFLGLGYPTRPLPTLVEPSATESHSPKLITKLWTFLRHDEVDLLTWRRPTTHQSKYKTTHLGWRLPESFPFQPTNFAKFQIQGLSPFKRHRTGLDGCILHHMVSFVQLEHRASLAAIHFKSCDKHVSAKSIFQILINFIIKTYQNLKHQHQLPAAKSERDHRHAWWHCSWTGPSVNLRPCGSQRWELLISCPIGFLRSILLDIVYYNAVVWNIGLGFLQHARRDVWALCSYFIRSTFWIWCIEILRFQYASWKYIRRNIEQTKT